MGFQEVLSPAKRLPAEIKRTIVADIEAEPAYPGEPLNTKFLGAGVYDGSDYWLFDATRDSDAEYKFFCFLTGAQCANATIFFHNGTRYDNSFLLGYFMRDSRRWQFFGGSRYFIKGKDRIFADSMAIIPMSLDRMGEHFNLAVRKGSIDYTNIRNEPWQDYLKTDCLALYEGIEEMRRHTRELGGALKLTLAATAMTILRMSYLDRDIVWTPMLEGIERSALHGGRTELFKARAEGVTYYDINSSYSASAINDVPYRWDYSEDSPDHWGSTDIVEARVHVPDMYYPPLPLKRGKLLFPTGRWTGHYFGIELDRAIEVGCTVEPICRRVYHAAPILRQYSLDLYAEKRTGHPAAKLLLNALYGRFAMNLERENIIMRPGEEWLNQRIQHPDIDYRPREFGPKEAYCFRYLERAKSFCFPPLFGYITANARVRLHRALVATNAAVYCDTDSVMVERSRLGEYPDIGPEMGKWKVEGEAEGFDGVGPKAYRLRKFDKLDGKGGKDKIRIKGIRTPEKWEPGAEYAVVRMHGLKTLLKNPDQDKLMKGTRTLGYIRSDKRIFDADGIDSRPVEIIE